MRNRNKIIVLLTAIILCVAFFQRFVSTEPVTFKIVTATPDSFTSVLEEVISSKLGNTDNLLIMADVTPFDWEKMYIVEPYTQASDIKRLVSDDLDNSCYEVIMVSDSYTLLLFTNGNEVMLCSYFPRSEGIFIIPPSKYASGISKQEATFKVDDKKRLILSSN